MSPGIYMRIYMVVAKKVRHGSCTRFQRNMKVERGPHKTIIILDVGISEDFNVPGTSAPSAPTGGRRGTSAYFDFCGICAFGIVSPF